MTEKFNLSSKIIDLTAHYQNEKDIFIQVKDVKEFIRILKDKFDLLESHLSHTDCDICIDKIKDFKEDINSLAGEELSK